MLEDLGNSGTARRRVSLTTTFVGEVRLWMQGEVRDRDKRAEELLGEETLLGNLGGAGPLGSRREQGAARLYGCTVRLYGCCTVCRAGPGFLGKEDRRPDQSWKQPRSLEWSQSFKLPGSSPWVLG